MMKYKVLKYKVSSVPENLTEEQGTPLTVIQATHKYISTNRLIQASLGTNQHHRPAGIS